MAAFDIIIVGGGFAGLSAGALLARAGRRVLLLEQAERLGGRAAYFEQDGFVWQYGQHSHRLAHDGIAAEVFRRIGGPLDFVDTRGADAYLYLDGRLYPRPEGALDFLRTPLLPFAARMRFLRFYAKLLGQDPAAWYDRTLLDMYRAFGGRDPALERFLSFLGFTVMIPDPARVSAGEVVRFLQRAAKAKTKQGEPRSGSKQVIDTLRDAFVAAGGTLRLGERVEALRIERGRAAGVRTVGGQYDAERVVFAAPVSNLFEIAPESAFDPALVRYAKNLRPSSGLSIDFVFDEPVFAIRGGILGIDIPLWVKFQSNLDPTVAPPGKQMCTWAMLFDFDAPPSPETVAAAEMRIKAILEEIAPGAMKRIVRERKLVLPVVNANMLVPEQSYPHRPAILREDVPGLYLIGDTTQGDGCSGDIAFSSAMKLADALP